MSLARESACAIAGAATPEDYEEMLDALVKSAKCSRKIGGVQALFITHSDNSIMVVTEWGDERQALVDPMSEV